MTLRELDGQFLSAHHPDGSFSQIGDQLASATGVMFQCPKCSEGKKRGEEDGRKFVVGAHYVICWFVGVPMNITPGPGRWNPSGTSLDDLTFIGPGAISVLLTSGCGWHGFVRDGEATLN